MNRDSNQPKNDDDSGTGSDRDDDQTTRDKQESRQMLRQVGQFGHIGLQFGIATGIGFLVGRWLDGKLDTAPWLAITLALCGTASAALDLYKLVKRIQRENNS